MNNYDNNILGTGNPLHPANDQPEDGVISYGHAMSEAKSKLSNEAFEAISNEWETSNTAKTHWHTVASTLTVMLLRVTELEQEIHEIETDPFTGNVQYLSDNAQRLRELKDELLTLLRIKKD